MNRRLIAVGMALVPLIIVMAMKWPSGPPFQFGDPFHYLLHARAIAEGRPYGDTGYIFSTMNPWHGPRFQPPGLPLTLAPLILLTGGGDVVIQIGMFLFALAFLGAAGWYFAGQQGIALGVGVTLTTGFGAEFFGSATFALSDLPFAFLFWLLIILVEQKDRPGPGRIAAVTAVGLLAVSYRAIGGAVGPALIVYALLAFEQRKRWLIPVGLWAVVGGIGLMGSSLSLSSFGPSLADPLGYLSQAPARFFEYRYSLLSGLLYPLPWNRANDVYHVLAIPFLLLGFVSWFRSNPRGFALWFGIIYMVLLIALPIRPSARYVWPLFPIIMYCALRGVSVAAGRIAPAQRQRVVVGTSAIIATCAILTVLSRPVPPAVTSHPGVASAIDYLANTDSKPTLLVSLIPRVLTWYTRVPGMAIPTTRFDDEVVAELEDRDVGHVIVTNVDREIESEIRLRRVIAGNPDQFSPVFESDGLILYKFSKRSDLGESR